MKHDHALDQSVLDLLPPAPEKTRWVNYHALERGDHVLVCTGEGGALGVLLPSSPGPGAHAVNPAQPDGKPIESVDIIVELELLEQTAGEGVDRSIWMAKTLDGAQEGPYLGLVVVVIKDRTGPFPMGTATKVALVHEPGAGEG